MLAKETLFQQITKIYSEINKLFSSKKFHKVLNTIEIPQFHFTLEIKNITEIHQLEKQITKSKELKISSLKYQQKLAQEKTHYELIYSQLLHQINMIKFFYGENYNTRKWIYFNPLECISLIQILIRNKTIYYSIVWRSCDFDNLFLVDLINCLKILERIINYLGISTNKIKVFGLLNSLHKYIKDE